MLAHQIGKSMQPASKQAKERRKINFHLTTPNGKSPKANNRKKAEMKRGKRSFSRHFSFPFLNTETFG